MRCWMNDDAEVEGVEAVVVVVVGRCAGVDAGAGAGAGAGDDDNASAGDDDDGVDAFALVGAVW